MCIFCLFYSVRPVIASKIIHLIIFICLCFVFYSVRPVIAYTVPYIDVIKGKNVTLDCVLVQGNPKPTVHWLARGQELMKDNHFVIESASKVVITNIQEEHEGVYTCLASNVAGNSTSVVSINVQGGYKCKVHNKVHHTFDSNHFNYQKYSFTIL